MKKYSAAFFGTPDFAVPMLRALASLPEIELQFVVSQPDRKNSKGKLESPPVAQYAKTLGVPLFQPEAFTKTEYENFLNGRQLDVAIVVAWGVIISKDLLLLPKFGWLNMHASLLPEYRGASPIASAIKDGKKETGVSLMKINEGIDTGSIIALKQTPIMVADTTPVLTERLARLGSELLAETLLPYLNDQLVPKKQPIEGSYARQLKKEDGHINWTKSAEEIERLIRAYTPWPGTFAYCENEGIKIHAATFVNKPTNANVGTVIPFEQGFGIVCAHDSILIPTIIQRTGKQKQQASDFLKGYRKILGQTLT